MPRQARIDFPGALHHIMVRGIQQCKLFRDDWDRRVFLDKLERALREGQVKCFAFTLMPNHFHLLVTTGKIPISKVMQSLLTGYAVYFNDRHGRVGKLYQNRFKSILCDRDSYFLTLIRYIHLNPIKAGIISGIDDLNSYLWSSHSALMGNQKIEWLDSEEVLSQFGGNLKSSRKAYGNFILDGLSAKTEPDFSGGGLVRSLGGYWETLKANRGTEKEAYDERILGTGAFVENVLQFTGEREDRMSQMKRNGWGFEQVLDCAAQAVGLDAKDLLKRGRGNSRTTGRALLCKWLVVDLQEKQTEVGQHLSIGRSAVSRLISKGEKAEVDLGVNLYQLFLSH